MFPLLNHLRKSRTPVVLHFIEKVRQGTTAQSYSIYFFRRTITYLFISIYIYIYIKYLLRVRLFSHMLAFPEKKLDKRKRKGVVVDLSYSYKLFERKLLFIKWINAQYEVRLLSRTPVVPVVPQSFFENITERPSWS
jgi:hypothetical protein